MTELSGPKIESLSDRIQYSVGDFARFAVFVAKRFKADGVGKMASALGYTSLLALVPLIVIAFSIFAAFPAFEGARAQLEQLVFENIIPEMGGQIRGYLLGFAENASKLTIVGIVALAVSAILLLNTIEDAFNRIWKSEHRRPILLRILIYWALLTIGPILLSVGVTLTTDTFNMVRDVANNAGVFSDTFDRRTWYVDRAISIGIQALGFAVLFKLVPNRPIHWGDALKGGITASLLFELLKLGFVFYLTNFPTYQTVYGAMAVMPIFLIWLYLSWMVILAGAETAAALPDWRIHRSEIFEKDTAQLRLSIALTLLKTLSLQAQKGGAMSFSDLLEDSQSSLSNQVAARLSDADFIVQTDEGEAVLARDLSSATLYDLAVALDGIAGDVTSDIDALNPVLQAWRAAEKDSLSSTVKSVLDA